MNRTYRSALVVSFVVSLVVVSSVVADESVFHVVDMQKVVEDSISGKAARNNLKAEAQKREGKLQILRKDLERLKEDAKKQVALLSAEALEQKQEQLERKERDFERALMDEREAMQKFNDDQVGRLMRESELAVRELADKNGFKFVLVKDSSFVVYVGKKYDITEQVIKKLDSKSLG